MRFGSASIGFLAVVLLLGSGGAWLHAGELPKPPTAPTARQERAIERLDSIGVERTGQIFVRMVTATHGPMVELFLDSGIDLNTTGDKGRTGLLAAILVRDWPTAERLITAGADPKKADENGFTPLMGAALGGNLTMVKTLLAHGASTTAADHTGHTALHYAIASRQREIEDCFLQANTPLPDVCADGKDLLTHALETHDRQIIDPILSRSPQLASWSAEACEALTMALEAKDWTLGKQLIAKHTTPPVPAEKAQPSLAYAVAQGDLERLGALLDCGADPNAPLSQTADPAFKELVGANFMRYYLEKEPGLTPLMIAAGMRRVDCVKVLLARGADRLRASKSKSELLPLYFAAWAECPEAVQLLVANDSPKREQLRVAVDLSQQRATLFQNGVAAFSTEISSGKSGKATPVGEFVITDKDLDHHSSIYHNASMPFFMRLSCRDFGMHQGYVTGRPASHGCIRLPEAAARKLYKELPIGTWVSVTR